MPAVSRPLLIALALAVVALVAFYATQGARDSSSDDGAAAPLVETAAPPATDGAGAGGSDSAARGDSAAAPAAARAAAKRAQSRPARRGMPAPMRRALRQDKTVVLFLGDVNSADDRAAAAAVAAQRRTPGVAVFRDRIDRIGRYRAVVGSLGIDQAPAVVIVGRDRSARVVEGFVDATTLSQDVADAR